jgi:polyisoprenoid-binding protein YceI
MKTYCCSLNRSFTRIFVAAAALAASLTASSSIAASAKNCEVTFVTIGKPVLVEIQGTSKKPCKGKFEFKGGKLGKGTFSMELTDIDTGIPLRNRHLRENYLHTDKHPVAKAILAPDATGAKKGGEYTLKGDLDLHGVIKPFEAGRYSVNGKTVTTKIEVELPSWDIERPSFMGVKIVDRVLVTIKFDVGA